MSEKWYDVCVMGLGPVGTVSGLCYAKQGLRVIGADIDSLRVAALQAGKAPFVEPGIESLIEGVRGNFVVTTDIANAVQQSHCVVLAVGTPTSPTGTPDLSYLEKAAESIGNAWKKKMTPAPIVVVRSTVPPGTMRNRLMPIIERQSGKKAGRDFYIAANPEFLREGMAIADFFDTGRVVIGADDMQVAERIEALYKDVQGERIRTTIETAEFAKYVDNSWHALKVAFANEIGRTVTAFGGNVEDTTRIFLADDKLNISARYLRPGFAFGGSCLPKDVRGLSWFAAQQGASLPIIDAILPSNAEQIAQGTAAVLATGAEKIGLLGIAFKEAVDDLRESPALMVAAQLKARGVQVVAHDRYYEPGSQVALPQGDAQLAMKELHALQQDCDLLVKFHNTEEYNRLQESRKLPVLDLTRTVQVTGVKTKAAA